MSMKFDGFGERADAESRAVSRRGRIRHYHGSVRQALLTAFAHRLLRGGIRFMALRTDDNPAMRVLA